MKPQPLFKTDQTGCFDADGKPLTCAGSGQDGELRMGRSWPCPRFEAHSQTVHDRLTGLMWTRDAALSRFPLTWNEALDFVRQMNREAAFGYRDWKLPSRAELFGVISHVHINPALPYRAPFENVFPGYYWTETTASRLEAQAWYVHLGGGRVYRGMKHGSYMVWPVRRRSNGSGHSPADGQRSDAGVQNRLVPADRFVVRSGDVYDQLTGLGWAPRNTLRSDPVSWTGALAWIRQLNAADRCGHADWRLPNIRELESIIDIRYHSPALSGGHPFGRVSEGCWSSTTSVYEPRYAWVVYMQDGAVGVGYKKQAEFHVWAVRGEST